MMRDVCYSVVAIGDTPPQRVITILPEGSRWGSLETDGTRMSVETLAVSDKMYDRFRSGVPLKVAGKTLRVMKKEEWPRHPHFIVQEALAGDE